MTWAADDRREHRTGSVVTGETGLDHAGSVINDYSSDFDGRLPQLQAL
jgi:hypothetical protein